MHPFVWIAAAEVVLIVAAFGLGVWRGRNVEHFAQKEADAMRAAADKAVERVHNAIHQ